MLYRHLFIISIASSILISCSTKGPDVIDPSADERTETALMALNKSGTGEIARYYEVAGLIDQSEYESANGEGLGLPIDAIYERYERLWLHSDSAGTITVLDLLTRKKLAEINGFPSGGEGRLCGMAFSNLSQAWVIARNAKKIYHVDARNLLLDEEFSLPGNPTAIATNSGKRQEGEDPERQTGDNRVYVALEDDDGTGSIVAFHSNDPDRVITTIAEFPRPPFFISANPDGQFLAVLVPGEATDNPGTFEIETDPLLFIVDLFSNQIVFQRPFISPPLLDYVGHHPNFASMTEDSFIYLGTPDGVMRIDTKAWGEFTYVLPGRAYRVVSANYWSDLLYAVPTDAPNSVERMTKGGNRLSSVTLDHPVQAIRFVSTNRIDQ